MLRKINYFIFISLRKVLFIVMFIFHECESGWGDWWAAYMG